MELSDSRSVILPYMSLVKVVRRNGEIMLEFGAAQVHVTPSASFNTTDFLDGIGAMQIARLTDVEGQCKISVLIDPMEPKEESV